MSSSVLDEALVPTDVSIDSEMIHVRFRGGLQIAVPVARYPRLQAATPAERTNWRLIGKGDGIHWPDVDEDVSVRALLSDPAPSSDSRFEEMPVLIGNLLKTTARLNALFPDRPFTPDGHLVGSIGEVVAEYIYGIMLEPCSTPQIDARTKDGKTVQVKLTGERGRSFAFRWSSKLQEPTPDFLLCLKMTRAGFREIYNGPFPLELLHAKPDATNGQVSLAASSLEAMNPGSLAKRRSFESINRWFQPELADVA